MSLEEDVTTSVDEQARMMMITAVITAVPALEEVACLKMETMGLDRLVPPQDRMRGQRLTYPIAAVLSSSTSWTENKTHMRKMKPLQTKGEHEAISLDNT